MRGIGWLFVLLLALATLVGLGWLIVLLHVPTYRHVPVNAIHVLFDICAAIAFARLLVLAWDDFSTIQCRHCFRVRRVWRRCPCRVSVW